MVKKWSASHSVFPLFAFSLSAFIFNLSAFVAHSAESRIVDSILIGNEQNELQHQFKSEGSEIRTTNNQAFRFATTNGWFSWELKVLPDVAQELAIDFGGGGGGRGTTNLVEITVDGSRVANLRLVGTPRQQIYPLTNALVNGKSAVTVKFQAAPGSRVLGVSGVRVEKRPAPTIASTSVASSTRTTYQYIVNVINDQREATSSGDQLKAHFDWWPARNTNQWVQYDFAKPARVSAVEVYWFDDTGRGDCRMPKSWEILSRQNGEWKPVTNPSARGCEPNQYNRATFDPVETDGLRLDVRMPDTHSAGILQWRVE